MATADSSSQNTPNSSATTSENGPVSDVTVSLEQVSLQEPEEPSSSSSNGENQDPPRRRLHVYPRPHILFLSKSPLVEAPDGMPVLKDWFGDWTDQQISSKKDPESAGATTGTRDRRFRRDADDGELPPRPAFRTTLSQPSQMGNFRHQSIRTTERDKDKETDKERERDIRDKEGAEKLRSLSDKYDRDRLALSSTTLRGKDRDSAPHLSGGSSGRLGQGQGTNGTRRTEARESTKRKPGESEDWRRGPETGRQARDDRPEPGRRDNRERPRSRSRIRREPSPPRRDRERDRDDRVRDRRGEDRDDDRRERDDYPRRDRDDFNRRDWGDRTRDRDDNFRDGRDRREYDRDLEEDPRRWRDDGKRDERIAARRDRDQRDRGWDRWEPGNDRDRERPDERDGRSKRTAGRDRRTGAEDGKEKEDRREREKEKEPAWMETYVPSSPGAGILGGQSAEGELDGIQAWKKGLKEKERKEKELEDPPESYKKSPEPTTESSSPSGQESGMDEIQLFKLMMKREAEKKDTEPTQNGKVDSPVLISSSLSAGAGSISSLTTAEPQGSAKLSSIGEPTTSSAVAGGMRTPNGSVLTETSKQPTAATNGPSLLSLISSSSPGQIQQAPSADPSGDLPQPAVSRFFPNLPALQAHSPNNDRSPIAPAIPSPESSFQPPQGSRLLAFASRAPGPAAPGVGGHLRTGNALDSSIGAHSTPGLPPSASVPVPSKTIGFDSPNFGAEYQHQSATRMTPSESAFASRSYSPFGQSSQNSFGYEETQDPRLGLGNEAVRRASGLAPSNQFSPSSEAGLQYQELGNVAPPNGSGFDLSGNPAGGNYATGKGSRFAKFFDAKPREPQVPVGARRTSVGAGFVSTSPRPGQRQDPIALNGMGGANPENRTMEDIFAMLQNSAQNHRMSPQIGQPSRNGGAQFNPGHAELQALQLQQLQQQQYAHNRLESLYDSRLDDRNFVPDGMVPGLRPAPRPRSREPSGALFNEHLDDPIQFSLQQRMQQQPRNLEQMYSGPMYNHQPAQQAPGRNASIHLQQAQFRGGPSPLQGSIPNPGNRLPPGLANLGGRPPHDPSQFINAPMGVPGGLHGGISPSGPAQQGFGNFGGGNLGFAGAPQSRGPIPGPHLQNQMALNQMAGLGPNNNLDARGQNQAQFLGMGGVGGLGGNMRGGNFNPQHGPGGQMQNPHLAALRQQQQHLPPHLVQQMLSPHLQQQQGIPGGSAQGAQDLMALLMGNHRD
ncbi:hypothetical protein EIP91_005604 [Steccherinum ochraceum]|uniref:Uncharacterized protein n=1 Tax=Steccherinum ochraceum TaxID=92696 RepID=A0A4R0R9L6_9APHY|nr:hypothetical protein EIP91_005604 [Steccherinum ochraceum]